MNKKFFALALIIMGLGITSCQYNDDELWDNVNKLDSRVTKLETLCNQLNDNIASLRTIVDRIDSGDYITGIQAMSSSEGTITGYTISFYKHAPITIYYGIDGKNGKDGKDGKDGHSPVVGVRQGTDGLYYWTIDNEFLLNAQGQKILAQGQNGTDGEDGKDGKDAITPQLKIEEDYWYVSYDNGESWTQLYQAKGDDGDTMFANIDYTTSDQYVVFTLADGTELKVPTWAAFESLQILCNQMNTNLIALQALVNALEENDWITGITPVMDDAIEVGYTITFAKGNPITIYHGKNGKDGQDGSGPKLGIKQDEDGKYYWTLNDDWMLSEDGNKIQAKAEDGMTPTLKIFDNYWYVSTDGGENWKKLDLAVSGDSVLQDMTQDNQYVYFHLTNGTIISVAKSGVLVNIQFTDSETKAICIANFDTDEDGELTYAEAAAVTSLPEGIFSGKTIVYFNELKYFTSLKEIASNTFTYCTLLKRITLPAETTIIGNSVFEGCAMLKDITLPETLTAIGDNAFKGCGALATVWVKGATPATLGTDAFKDCTNLTHIYVDSADLVEAYQAAWPDYADIIGVEGAE